MECHMRVIAGLDASDNLSIDIETLADFDYLLGFVGRKINLQTMSHIEDLIHLLPIGARLLVDGAEERRNREKIVFYDVQVLDEMQHLGLRTTGTMHHAMDVVAHSIEHFLDHREDRQGPHIGAAVLRMLRNMGNIFQEQMVSDSTRLGLHIDRKRRRQLQEKRLAMGHKPDDHEEEENNINQTMQ